MNVRYRVELSQAERDELKALLAAAGAQCASSLKRAQILLAAGVGGEERGVGGSTVDRTKRRFVIGNLEAALSEEPRPGADRKLSGKGAAMLIATACSNPPEGRARWTLELLADELVSAPSTTTSRQTVRWRLVENELKPLDRRIDSQGTRRVRNRCLGAAQCFTLPHKMAVHDRESTRRNGPSLP